MTTRLPAAMLSCYTAALVELLGRTDQDIDARFCDAVQLRVRTDSPVTLFSHHRRVDVTDGGGLGYTGAPTWADTLIGLTADVEADGCVIAVADTAALPWTPKRSAAGRPHWVLVARAMDRWRVTDVFEAQLPDGRVHAADVVVDVGFLRDLLTPAADRSDHVRARDEMALGEPVTCPPSHWFRWLKRSERGGPAATAGDAAAGDWTTSTGQSLHWVADQLRQRPGLLTSWQQDLWAAARLSEGGRAVNDEGELCVRGPQRFTGYHDPADNLGRFFDEDKGYFTPYDGHGEITASHWYRTGDLVGNDAGNLVHRGRLDTQLKIRGYRVELTEIEHGGVLLRREDAVPGPGPDPAVFAAQTLPGRDDDPRLQTQRHHRGVRGDEHRHRGADQGGHRRDALIVELVGRWQRLSRSWPGLPAAAARAGSERCVDEIRAGSSWWACRRHQPESLVIAGVPAPEHQPGASDYVAMIAY